jgi:hypothetical protein
MTTPQGGRGWPYSVQTPGMDADEWVTLAVYDQRPDAERWARQQSRGYRHDPVRVIKRRTVALFCRGRRIGRQP